MENCAGLWPALSGKQYAQSLERQLAAFGIQVVRARVESIACESSNFVATSEICKVVARRVIIATGTEPIRLPIANEPSLRGELLFYEPSSLSSPTCRVAVIGSGEAACDYALNLADKGIPTTILVRGSSLKARGRLLKYVTESPLTEIRLNCAVASIAPGPGGAVLNLVTGKTDEEMMCSAVLVAIGRKPVHPMMPGVSLAGDIETSMSCVFAVGDLRLGSLGQAGIAVGDGLQAAMLCAGLGG
jgi:thioredoxin reductase (NADPH)